MEIKQEKQPLEPKPETAKFFQFKMRLPHETRYFSINASILERLYGKESCILSMWHDSTSIKLAEEKLRMSEIKFHTICASAHDAIITIDNEGRVSYWNDSRRPPSSGKSG